MKIFLDCYAPVRGGGERNDKIRQGSNQKTANLRVVGVFFVTLRKELAENANKSCHVCRVIVVLHIYNKSLLIRLAGHPSNKNKSLVLRLF